MRIEVVIDIDEDATPDTIRETARLMLGMDDSVTERLRAEHDQINERLTGALAIRYRAGSMSRESRNSADAYIASQEQKIRIQDQMSVIAHKCINRMANALADAATDQARKE